MSRQRKKRHIVLKCILAILILGGAALYICRDQVKSVVTKKAASVVAEKLIEEKLANEVEIPSGLDVSSMIETMDDADVATVTDIVEENMDEETVSDVTSYITSGDMTGLKQYVKDTLDGEDETKITEIYDKYKDQYAQEIEEYRLKLNQ